MKRKLSLIIITLLAVTLIHAQQSWVDYKVDDKVSIKFPYAPKEVKDGSSMAVNPDSSAAYICTLVDFAKIANLDSATLTPIETTPDFLAELKAGLKTHLPNVADLTLGTFNGYNSYTTSGFDDKKKRYDFFMFIIGTRFYSLSAVCAVGVLFDNRDKFFSSVTIAK